MSIDAKSYLHSILVTGAGGGWDILSSSQRRARTDQSIRMGLTSYPAGLIFGRFRDDYQSINNASTCPL